MSRRNRAAAATPVHSRIHKKKRSSRPFRSAAKIAVPNNDSDKAGREWSAGRPFDLATIRTMKSVIPREVRDRTKRGPHVCYPWEVSAENPAFHAVWQTATFLHTFGWGIDMAYADSFVLDKDGRRVLVSNSELSLYSPSPSYVFRPLRFGREPKAPPPSESPNICGNGRATTSRSVFRFR